jgi:protein-tyrosine-phosphatase
MHLLFVCTGNTCRSPLAEAIARRLIRDRAIAEMTVGSAGISAWPGGPASDGALLVALEHGIDLSDQRARQLTAEIVAHADLILTMGPQHLDRAETLGGVGRSALLTAFAGGIPRAVSDPFGGDLHVYRETFAELETEITAVLDRIVADRARSTG